MLFKRRRIKRVISTCLNCGREFVGDDSNYCDQCGQIRTDGMIKVWDLIRDFFEDLFNIESRIFQSLKLLVVPGQLTQEFFKGKHNTYYKPIRLFFVSMILFFATLGFLANDEISKIKVVEDISEINENARFQALIDSSLLVYGEDEVLQPEVQIYVDSLRELVSRKTSAQDSMDLVIFGNHNFKWHKYDILNDTRKEILEKYELEGINSYLYPQVFRFMKYPDEAVRFLIGNLTWVIVLLIFSMALVMKLLYIRRKHFYVEHLVFQFHVHSFGFILMIIEMLLLYLLVNRHKEGFSMNFNYSILVAGIYFLVAQYRYYGQRFFKTLLKFMILGFFYFVLSAIFILLVGIISVLIF